MKRFAMYIKMISLTLVCVLLAAAFCSCVNNRVVGTVGEYEVAYDVKAVNGGNFRIRVVAGGKTIANIAASAKGSHWVQKKGKFTVPEGVKEVAFYLHVSNLSDAGYFDNITLARLKK